jgi:hypothetical protein
LGSAHDRLVEEDDDREQSESYVGFRVPGGAPFIVGRTQELFELRPERLGVRGDLLAGAVPRDGGEGFL